jgi:hypothetical protein
MLVISNPLRRTRMSSELRIYMNDQLALGIVWREVAKRAARENAGSDAGSALAEVAQAISEDVRTFEAMMRRLGLRRNIVKCGLAMAAERAGRLKLNGSLRSYSPLSRFSELEFLIMGIEGKKQLWATLSDLAALSLRLPDVDFAQLIARAEAQRAALEPHRASAGHEVFSSAHVAALPRLHTA